MNHFTHFLDIQRSWIFILACLVLVVSCGEEKPASESLEKVVDSSAYTAVDPMTWMTPDSARVIAADEYVMSVRRMEEQGAYVTGRIGLSAAFSDSLDYFMQGDELIKIQSLNKGPAQELWLEYYFKDGQLVFMRHREWNHRPEASSAREIYIYFQNNVIFFALERYTPLAAFQPPIELLDLPLKMTDRPRENLMYFVNRLWPSSKALIDEDLKAKG